VSVSTLSLAERFDPCRNNFTLQRLLLAAIVVLVHGQSLSSNTQPSVFKADLGELAVDGFFVLSGFLVTRSALRLDSVRRFAWHRLLRILPGFWVCLLVTALVVAPLLAVLEGRPALSVFSGPDSALHYVLRNSALLIRQFGIAGLRADQFMPGVLDGSLWSLFYEGLCYVGIGALALAGVLVPRPTRVGGRHSVHPLRLLVHRRLLVAALVAALWGTLVLDKIGVALPMHMGRQMIFVFLIGALAELYAEHIPMDWRLAVAGAAVWQGSCALMYEYRLVGGLAFGYVLLWLAAAARVVPQPRADFSYGVYMYHWPIDTILLGLGLGSAGLHVFLICSAALTFAVAAASWFLIESPALRFKNAAWVQRPALRSRSVRTPAPGVAARPATRSGSLARR
jgi:peptidoglycan/LPS O-acetylase OafA/YrhL